MGKLNLFRKGRGKEYRQTKRAIKKEIRKTGGFTGTAGAEGKFTITGGTGAVGGSQSGWARRNLARGAAESMTSGIDKIADLGGSDTQTYGGGVAGKTKKTITKGPSKGAYSWKGEGITAGVTTTASSDVPVTGPTAENVQGQITELEKDNPKISMKSSAFKMKYSPFNQGYGSPLNWNERSPLNDLNKDGELVQSTKGQYMKEDSALPCNDCGDSSPLNQSSPLNETKEGCIKKGRTWKDGQCWDKKGEARSTTTSTTDEETGITTDVTRTQQDLEGGDTSERDAGSKSKQNCTAADRKAALAKCTGDNDNKVCSDNPNCCYTCKKAKSAKELEETKKADVTCAEDEKKVKKEGGGYKCVKDTRRQDMLETESQTSKGKAKVTTEETTCAEDEVLKDGKCVKKVAGGDVDVAKDRKVKKEKGPKEPKDCTGNRVWDPKKERCVKGPKEEKGPKPPKDCTGNRVWSEEKGRCVAGPKDEKEPKKPGMKKVCTDWEWVERGSGQGKKRSSAGPKPK